jgi:hypothetical protein
LDGEKMILKNIFTKKLVLLTTITALAIFAFFHYDNQVKAVFQVSLSRVTPDFYILGELSNGGADGYLNGTPPKVSSDGRYVVFASGSDNLVPNDINGSDDIFLRDNQTGTTIMVSVDSNGVHQTGSFFTNLGDLELSSDGRYVVFASTATNLVSNDTNGVSDVFLHNNQTGETSRVSVDSNGVEGNADSHSVDVSDDGRYVVFASGSDNLVPGMAGYFGSNIFLHDTQTGETTLVSRDLSGEPASAVVDSPSISGNGRYIFFTANANLVVDDTNSKFDVFLYDTQTDTTTRVSVDSNGVEANGDSYYSPSSQDGRYVLFVSEATNLIPNDTNGKIDTFLHDNQTGETTRVSVDSNGVQQNGSSYGNGFSISADGRYATFISIATNLVPNDTNGALDVFLHDNQTGETTRVSVDSNGVQGNYSSGLASISADGRYVVFKSEATNLVAYDTNSTTDTFLHDTQTGETTLVSRASDIQQTQSNAYSNSPSVSADGRYMTFISNATNLIPRDTNGKNDVFVQDTQTGDISRVSVATDGTETEEDSYTPSISADGRYVVFESASYSLVTNDPYGTRDVFLHDAQTGETTLVSLASDGITKGNYDSYQPSISSDGRYISFISDADNLVAGDTNGVADVFLHDTQTGTTTRVSVDSTGVESADDSYRSSISADGRYIAFISNATNLVAGDTNSVPDAFLHDTQTGITTRASVDSTGVEGDSSSVEVAVSDDGQYVIFSSFASNLTSQFNDAYMNIFRHNTQTGVTELVSSNSDGLISDGDTDFGLGISSDGRFVAFPSGSTDLIPNDTNNLQDIFVKDMLTGDIIRASINPDGTESNDDSLGAVLSSDGQYVAFYSAADNLVSNDTNAVGDIFYVRLQTSSLAYSGNFTETSSNNGHLDGSRVITLTNDTFAHAGGTLTEGVDYNLANVPTGLTPTMTVSSDGTTATLTLGGVAVANEAANSVNNLTITFINNAFTLESSAQSVTNNGDANGSISFDNTSGGGGSGGGGGGSGGGGGGGDNPPPDPIDPPTCDATNATTTTRTFVSNVPDWYNASWKHRIVITVNSKEVAQDINNFPVYVNLADLPQSFFQNIKSDGGDIRITTGDGKTELPYELVAIDRDSQNGEMYFQALKLSQSEDTDFYIYYGNDNAKSYDRSKDYGSEKVWMDYASILHASNNVKDSTANRIDGSISENVFYKDGQIGQGFYFDQKDGYIKQPANIDISKAYTLKAWFREDSPGSINEIMTSEDDSLNHAFRLFVFKDEIYLVRFDSENKQIETVRTSGARVDDKEMHYVVATFNSDFGTNIYVDGKLLGSSNDLTPNKSIDKESVLIGGINGSSNNSWNGIIDEPAILNSSIKESQVLTEFNNQSSPSDFYKISKEENQIIKTAEFAVEPCTQPPPPPPPVPLPVDEPPVAPDNTPTDPISGNKILGCLDLNASNYNSLAVADDGSCLYPPVITNVDDVAPPPPRSTISNIINKVKDIVKSIPEKPLMPIAAGGLLITTILLALLQPNILSIPIRFWNMIPVLLGYKRKQRPWGTVYDSVTKQPLDPVYVSLKNKDGSEATSAITDIDGRFGFLVESGVYKIETNKESYTFPSKKLSGKEHDELYDNLYFGEDIDVVDKERAIYKNIPMDATNFNWNEFAKSSNKKLMKFYSKRDLFFANISVILFIAGVLSSIILVTLYPNTLNTIIASIYALIIVLRIVGIKPKQAGRVTDTDGYPLSFGMIKLFSKSLKREIGHTIIGKTGKYYLLTTNGNYDMQILKKTGEDSYEKLYEKEIKVRRGSVSKDIKLG